MVRNDANSWRYVGKGGKSFRSALLQGMGKLPMWKCVAPRCGEANNFANRTFCGACDRAPPREVREKQEDFKKKSAGGENAKKGGKGKGKGDSKEGGRTPNEELAILYESVAKREGPNHSYTLELKKKLEEARKEKVESKPLHLRTRNAEQALEREKGKVATGEKAIEEMEEQIRKLTQNLGDKRRQVEEAKSAVERHKAEVATLYRRTAEEKKLDAGKLGGAPEIPLDLGDLLGADIGEEDFEGDPELKKEREECEKALSRLRGKVAAKAKAKQEQEEQANALGDGSVLASGVAGGNLGLNDPECWPDADAIGTVLEAAGVELAQGEGKRKQLEDIQTKLLGAATAAEAKRRKQQV